MRETFAGPHALALSHANVLGVLSLVFWLLVIVVTLKYIVVMMRADNRGEGGSLALYALVARAVGDRPRLAALVAILGIVAAGLFYGDTMITPAISVLSAAEGIRVAAPEHDVWILPVTLAILLALFLFQRQASTRVERLFGPVMLVWFLALAILGIRNLALAPSVLAALSPHYALLFLFHGHWSGFLTLGSVVLAVTGCEALYADMGRFGRLPIRLAWYLLVLPALILNYFGQGALLLAKPAAIAHPFFGQGPPWMEQPLLVLAIVAAVTASQTVISGAFSMTHQAIQLGYLPRMTVIHTSAREIGRIYVPFVNWVLLLASVGLVVGFETASNLAAAYGMAVTGTMLISTILLTLVMTLLWGWRGRRTTGLVATFLLVDSTLFLANLAKIPYGGWFPLAVAAVVYVMLTTWKSGRDILMAKLKADALPVEDFLAALSDRVGHVPGTAIFLTGTQEGVPHALLHNLKHNKIIHDRVVILTVLLDEVPFVQPERRLEVRPIRPNFHRLILRYGFMEDTNIPKALAQARTDQLGFFYEPMSTSYFLSRETPIPTGRSGMPPWREQLFVWMARSAASAMDFFHLPVNRVVELGSQVEI
jgi:KUP system potassium uptake protein